MVGELAYFSRRGAGRAVLTEPMDLQRNRRKRYYVRMFASNGVTQVPT